MSDPFQAALVDIYANLKAIGDPEFQDAVFTPATGLPIPCTIRVYKEDSFEPEGLTARVAVEMTIIEYQRAEIPRDAVKGETFTAGGVTYSVQSIQERDAYSIRVLVV